MTAHVIQDNSDNAADMTIQHPSIQGTILQIYEKCINKKKCMIIVVRIVSMLHLFIFVGHYHVMWTDYVSSALLYECYRVEADQRCSPGADHITMLSRTHNMSQTVYDMMVEKIDESCFTRSDLKQHRVNKAALG